MSEEGGTSMTSEPGEAARVLVRVADDNAKPVSDPEDELMSLKSESATALESDGPSICCNGAVARGPKVETRATLYLPSPTRNSMS